MTKVERELLGKRISNIIKQYKEDWQDLKEQIYAQGYQSYYTCQEQFEYPIKMLVRKLSPDEVQLLINEWKNRRERIQFDNDEDYLKQYEPYIMEELVSRASKATYYM